MIQIDNTKNYHLVADREKDDLPVFELDREAVSSKSLIPLVNAVIKAITEKQGSVADENA